MKRFSLFFFVFTLFAAAMLIAGCDSEKGGTVATDGTTLSQVVATTTIASPASAATTKADVTTANTITDVTSEVTVTTKPPVTTTAQTTVQTQKPTPVKSPIAESGKSDYVVVYDGSNKALESSVKDFVSKVKTKFGFTLDAKPLASASTPAEREIVVGNVRASGVELEKMLAWTNDFAISASGNTVNVCATNEVSYNYLFEYLLNDGLVKKDGNVYLEVEGVFLYHFSSLRTMTYPDYHRKYSGTCEKEFMLKCFEDGTFKGTNGLSMKYRLYVPSNYDPNKDYPVILFLHGAGHRGNDNAAPVKGIIYNLFNHKNPLVDDTIVLVPQCPSGYQWADTPWAKGSYSIDKVSESKAMKTMLELLDKVEREYSTDKDRYYAFGLSMGGFGTWDVIMRHPERFAAAVALCGGADPSKGAVLKDMPIWTVHSLDDPTVPVKGTQDMVKAIKDAGGTKIIYDELNGYGHSVGTITAQREEVFTWLFSQSK